MLKTIREVKTITDNMLEKTDRFETFVLLIDAIHKCISRVKQDITHGIPIKSVHTMWLYELMKHPEGLTATELATKSMIDRSLVSRELRQLSKHGYITTEGTDGKRGYNSRITLTSEGKRITQEISAAALEVQRTVGLSDDELEAFYSALEKIFNNLSSVTERKLDGDDSKKGFIQ